MIEPDPGPSLLNSGARGKGTQRTAQGEKSLTSAWPVAVLRLWLNHLTRLSPDNLYNSMLPNILKVRGT